MWTVKFRLIVFRPFKGEIMLGKISGATEHGIKSTILSSLVQKVQNANIICSRCRILQRYPCTSRPPSGRCQIVSSPIPSHPFPIPQAINVLTLNSDYADQVWIWDSEDGSSFYFDVGEIVRLRVEMEEWHDQIPNAPDLGDGSASERKPPYSIIVGVSCLPFLSFWRF